jgi:hypothetical protein
MSQTFAIAVENGPTEYDLGHAPPTRCTLPPAVAVAALRALDPGSGADSRAQATGSLAQWSPHSAVGEKVGELDARDVAGWGVGCTG